MDTIDIIIRHTGYTIRASGRTIHDATGIGDPLTQEQRARLWLKDHGHGDAQTKVIRA